jgi:hypothetical protein
MVCEISLPRQPRRCLNADVLQLDARPSFASMATMSHAPPSYAIGEINVGTAMARLAWYWPRPTGNQGKLREHVRGDT